MDERRGVLLAERSARMAKSTKQWKIIAGARRSARQVCTLAWQLVQLVPTRNWPVFQEVLVSMPGNKSVGAGGLLVELLCAAGTDTQRAFYTAMINDLRQQRVPENWRVVLYALLEKKDANPDVVAERRETALMAQDMKLLLQMVRRVSYQRIVGRIVNAQAGWLSGYGCADTGSIAARIIQQQARLQRPLYLLYIDLATFFPRCDREVITVAEVVHGLPKAVRKLALLIYGSAHQLASTELHGCHLVEQQTV